MKFDSIEIFVVGNLLLCYGGCYFIFVKLVIVCGIIGYGEIYNVIFGFYLVV